MKSCGESGFPTSTQELEMTIHNHQNLYEQVTTAYTEVRGLGAASVTRYELYKRMSPNYFLNYCLISGQSEREDPAGCAAEASASR